MDAIITLDANQHIMLFNTAAERMFRCEAAEAIGQSIDRFIPERFRAVHHDYIDKYGRAGVTKRTMGHQIPLSGLRTDGEEFPVEASISQVDAAGTKFYTVILRDITERNQAEQAMRHLAALVESSD
ncbi:MAG TPA: PAS domain S-box protein, partial [Anaerolineae bacterium]|nr:PAS domain S-box protein [Anaerolineae bacterium]